MCLSQQKFQLDFTYILFQFFSVLFHIIPVITHIYLLFKRGRVDLDSSSSVRFNSSVFNCISACNSRSTKKLRKGKIIIKFHLIKCAVMIIDNRIKNDNVTN